MSESKNNDEIISISVIEQAIEFTSSSKFTIPVESFKTKNCESFQSDGESKTKEFRIDHTAIFNEYQELIDDLFEQFSREIGVKSSVIYQDCRDVGEWLILLIHSG